MSPTAAAVAKIKPGMKLTEVLTYILIFVMLKQSMYSEVIYFLLFYVDIYSICRDSRTTTTGETRDQTTEQVPG